MENGEFQALVLKQLGVITEQLVVLTDGQQELREDVSGLKGDVKELQGDVQGLKGDVKELQGDVRELQEGQRRLESRMETEVIDKIRVLFDADRVRQDDLAEIKAEIKQINRKLSHQEKEIVLLKRVVPKRGLHND